MGKAKMNAKYFSKRHLHILHRQLSRALLRRDVFEIVQRDPVGADDVDDFIKVRVAQAVGLNPDGTGVTEYDEGLVRQLIERITVYDDHLTFEFKIGLETEVQA